MDRKGNWARRKKVECAIVARPVPGREDVGSRLRVAACAAENDYADARAAVRAGEAARHAL